MEPLESDGNWTRELVALSAEARRQVAYAAEPFSSPDKAERSAMSTVRNRLRQIVADLEVAVAASRRIS